MATAYVSIVPSAKGFGAALGKEIGDPLESEGRRAGDRAGQGFSGAFGNSLKSLAVIAGSAFAAVGVGNFLKGSIEAASDLNETVSKSREIFEDQAASVEQWAATSAKSFGQSKKGALDAAATFGNFFDQMGLGTKESASLSKQMVELASDFASFHNADVTDVVDSMTAAFRGEYDAVQRFVPAISAATVEQKALALTGKETTKELTQQDKALAAQALLLEGAGKAMGDFDRTSQGMANQQRILGALWMDAKAQIGQALLPAVTEVVQFLVSTGIPAFVGLADAVTSGVSAVVEGVGLIAGVISTGGTENELQDGWRGVFERIGLAAVEVVHVVQGAWPGMISVVGEASQKLGEMADFLERNRDAILTVIVPLTTFATTLLAINKAIAGISIAKAAIVALGPLIGQLGALLLAAGPIGLLAAAIIALGVAAFIAYKKFEPFRNVVDTIGRAIRDVAITAFQALLVILPVVGGAVTTAFGAVRGAVETAVGALQRFAGFLTGLFQTAVTALTPLAQWFQANVVSTINAGLELVIAVFQRVWDSITAGVAFAVAVLGPAFAQMQAMFTVFSTVIGTVLQAIGIIIQGQVTFWVSVIQTFVGILGPLWSGLWENIKIVATAAFEIVKNMIETVLGVIRGVFQAVTGLVSGDWGKFWEGIRTIATSIFDGVKDHISTVWDLVKGIFSNAIETVQTTVGNGFNKLLGFFEKLPGQITDTLGDLGDLLLGAGEALIRGLINGIKNIASEAADAARGVVQGAIDAAQAVLQIGSPSKVFMEIGENTIQGFVLGVAGSTPAAVSQMNRFGGAITSSNLRLTPSLAGIGAGGAAAAGSGVVVNIHQPMNERGVAEELAWAMRTAGR